MNEKPADQMPTEEMLPISQLTLDPDVWPSRTVAEWVRLLDGEVFEDEYGRKCITATTAMALADEHRALQARHEEDRRQRAAERRPVPVAAGLPAVDGFESGIEVMMASGDYVTPGQEFGRPSPNFVAEELEVGRRVVAEKTRLAKKMKEDLK